MPWIKGSVMLSSLILLLSVASMNPKMQRIPTGVWGGQHISIEVGEKSAQIEYDCATGVIDGPLVLDANGHFNLRGKHTMSRGGPTRQNDDARSEPATYTGSIKGNMMTLTLKLGDSEPDTFTLEKGKPGDLFKCK